MRSVILFIAMSLDGYIADKEGGVGWLEEYSKEGEADTYSAFQEHVDTVVMGWNTYHQIITELSPSQWVYPDLTCYVITHRKLPSTEKIRFVQESPRDVVRKLKEDKGKDIWICGGSNIICPLIQDDLIDEYDISILPVLLGSGIRLFRQIEKKTALTLVNARANGGMTELIYRRRNKNLSI